MARDHYSVVSFDGVPAEGVQQIRLIEAEYEHERAVITVERDTPSAKRFKSGAPVSIAWGFEAPGLGRSFIGYVNHVEPDYHPGAGQELLLRVVCVAPTWLFKDSGYATHRNKTGPSVVKAVAQTGRFGVTHIQADTQVWPVFHQGGKSDWDFMVECAKKAGWTLFARGMDIYCLDRKKAVAATRATAPVLTPSIGGGPISEFTSQLGASSPGGGVLAARQGHSVNPRTGRAIRWSNKANSDRPMFGAPGTTPAFTSGTPDLTFESLGEADRQLRAAESQNRLHVTAEAAGVSVPKARVGSAVVMDGFVSDMDNGPWYVSAAEHVYRPPLEQSTMRLTLGRDSLYAGDRSPQSPTPVPPSRGARLVNRQWVLG